MGTHLPDDIAAWPAAAHLVLGVDASADARRIRKAYLALIRTFKPEQYPEQFRRIRAAFESMQDGNNWRPERDEHSRAPRPDNIAEASENQTAERSGSNLPGAWESALTGEPVAAYEGLQSLQRQGNHNAVIYLQLYWLALLWPEVDPDRHAVDWLYRGLKQSGTFDGPLRELLRREIEVMPSEALSAGFEELGRGIRLAEQVVPWCQMRWNAARQARQWHFIPTDLEGVRHVVGQDDVSWMHCLLNAYENLVWVGTAHAHHLDQIVAEIDRLDFLHARFELRLIRLEELQRLGQELADARHLFVSCRLLLESPETVQGWWLKPALQVKDDLFAVAANIVTGAETAVRELIDVESSAPTLLSVLTEKLELLGRTTRQSNVEPERDYLFQRIVDVYVQTRAGRRNTRAAWAGLLAETGIAISSLLPILRNVNHEAATTLCAALNKPYVEPNWIVDKFLEFLHKAHDELEKDRVLRCLAAAHQLYA